MIEIRDRYLRKYVLEDLKSRMVFVGGPRQVGKTTFALGFLPEPSARHPAYLNWDSQPDLTPLTGNASWQDVGRYSARE